MLFWNFLRISYKKYCFIDPLPLFRRLQILLWATPSPLFNCVCMSWYDPLPLPKTFYLPLNTYGWDTLRLVGLGGVGLKLALYLGGGGTPTSFALESGVKYMLNQNVCIMHTCKSVWLSVWLPSPNALQVIRSWSYLPSPKRRKSYAVTFDPPPQPTKVIRSVSDPLPRYDFSVKKYQFYY